jgi:DNA-binding NarL/FixJ family response regulator
MEGLVLVPNALIFLVGEELDYAFLMQSHLLRAGVRNPIFALRGFSESKNHLLQMARDKDWEHVTEPHLAVISVGQDGAGLEFLEWLRSRPMFRCIMALVSVERGRPDDLHRSLDLGANGFVYKDGDHAREAGMIAALTTSQTRSHPVLAGS